MDIWDLKIYHSTNTHDGLVKTGETWTEYTYLEKEKAEKAFEHFSQKYRCELKHKTI